MTALVSGVQVNHLVSLLQCGEPGRGGGVAIVESDHVYSMIRLSRACRKFTGWYSFVEGTRPYRRVFEANKALRKPHDEVCAHSELETEKQLFFAIDSFQGVGQAGVYLPGALWPNQQKRGNFLLYDTRTVTTVV
jgi:hypothetical protein